MNKMCLICNFIGIANIFDITVQMGQYNRSPRYMTGQIAGQLIKK